MSFSSFNNKVPFSIHFPNDSLFHISSRVFGCICLVHNMSLGLDKLFACAIKCVFLGYFRLQNGYWCYSPKQSSTICLTMLHSLNKLLSSLHLLKISMSYNKSCLYQWLSPIFLVVLPIPLETHILFII